MKVNLTRTEERAEREAGRAAEAEADAVEAATVPAADDWARWEAAGLSATAAAREELRAHGLDIVYGRDGKVWRETPSGDRFAVADESARPASLR